MISIASTVRFFHMESELENYKFQQQQIKEALDNDPDNEDLKKLFNDLQELIDLCSQVAPTKTQQEKPKKEPKKPSISYDVGDLVLAKWSDDQFYEALVVGRKDLDYEVVFTGYESIETLPPQALREPKPGQKRPTLLSSKEVVVGETKKLQLKLMSKERRKQKRKEQNRQDNVKDSERVSKWQQFQSKIKKHPLK
jgi:survival-of-motor-neuron-related-splicing factor 30